MCKFTNFWLVLATPPQQLNSLEEQGEEEESGVSAEDSSISSDEESVDSDDDHVAIAGGGMFDVVRPYNSKKPFEQFPYINSISDHFSSLPTGNKSAYGIGYGTELARTPSE